MSNKSLDRFIEEDSFKLNESVDDSALSESVKSLLDHSALPRSSLWIRRRLGWSPRVGSVLRRLETDGIVDYLRGGQWRMHQEGSAAEGGRFDPMSLVGPVWEPRVVAALRAKGIALEQQEHVLSYYLDISIKGKNGLKIDVEVDGRTHLTADGRRRTSDLIRDARLRATGWTVIRIWVRDLAADFDGVIESLVSRISAMEGG